MEKVARTSKKDFYIGNPKAKYEDWAVSRFTFGAIRTVGVHKAHKNLQGNLRDRKSVV